VDNVGGKGRDERPVFFVGVTGQSSVYLTTLTFTQYKKSPIQKVNNTKSHPNFYLNKKSQKTFFYKKKRTFF
jgi:hypothetical protein